MPSNFTQTGDDLDTYLMQSTYGETYVPVAYRKPGGPWGYWGELWTMGEGSFGKLGQGNSTTRSSPVQVGTLTTWYRGAIGFYHTLVTKNDFTLWSMGQGTKGATGLGTVTHYSSPVQVGSLTNWKLVSCGYYHSAAVKTDGTLWGWGYNSGGQLGVGNTTDRSSPTQVGSLTNWSLVSCGSYCTNAVKTDGTLWGYGESSLYRLGLTGSTNLSSPVQVGTDTNWSSVTNGHLHGMGIKTNGTIWSWGYNAYGQGGQGTSTSYVIGPTQIGTDTNWSSIACGRHHSLAIKTDGTLWVWGRNNHGQLGLGTTTNVSSPTQVGALTNWRSVNALNAWYTLAVKTDGTLWAWGRNLYGELGTGNTQSYSSPVQVGSLTTWRLAGAGGYSSFAIKS